MKERPILFSGPMVRAILEGRKTQTRRIVKPQPSGVISAMANGAPVNATIDPAIQAEERGCPYGQPGDRLWVRETWGLMPTQHEWEKWVVYQSDRIAHRAGMADDENVHHRPIDRLDEWTPRIWTGDDPKWKPSIHMPRWASRITLEVTGVRVERLQDISEEDAITEGVQPSEVGEIASKTIERIRGEKWAPSVLQYVELWESINGLGSWDANPWVWVVEFKPVQEGGAA